MPSELPTAADLNIIATERVRLHWHGRLAQLCMAWMPSGFASCTSQHCRCEWAFPSGEVMAGVAAWPGSSRISHMYSSALQL